MFSDSLENSTINILWVVLGLIVLSGVIAMIMNNWGDITNMLTENVGRRQINW